ncbi:Chemotaxis protein CheW [Sporomusa ovata DSM 2662]|uniref:Positive regulator of CheA protein activity (CheW) n=1 Tax=Sporomusa ovata TaxID=2378 RepID=A0A0U1L0P4_9FIRM|nr:chemotaxis protein CheW [Sporomusa ovata]EQB27275.1 chemotaxis signal transduction protein [Sporomusa ovata DSM 2662]CQR73115.1 Positive regulator of CheA protein activity (CheW) [Sporomusa ovata]
MANIQLVIFEIDGSEYGIDALTVNGILRAQKYKIQKIPGLPREIEGMINLRGQVNYIFNLRKKFGLSEISDAEETKFIMLNINGQVVGCIADEVTDIVHFNEEDLQPAPTLGSNLTLTYIKGIGKVDERMIIILDPIQLLSTKERLDLETPLVKLSDLAIPS